VKPRRGSVRRYSRSNPFHRIRDDVLDLGALRLQLTVDGEHRHSVDRRPDELRQSERIIASNALLLLKRHERVDQRLKCPSRFGE
jgi:hypothetical protein